MYIYGIPGMTFEMRPVTYLYHICIERHVLINKHVLIVQIQVHVLINKNIYVFGQPGCSYKLNELCGQH